MAQRFKELNKDVSGSFYSSIESNGLVEIQEYIYTKSFEPS